MEQMDVHDVLKQVRLLRKAGRHAEALKLLNEVMEKTVDPRLFYSRAMTFDQMKQADKAVEDLNSAVAMDKGNPTYLFDRGCILAFPLDKHDDAIRDFEEVLRLKPDHVEAHRQCCGSLLIMGRPNRALEHAEAALELAPEEASTYFYIGEAYISLKRYKEAEAALKKALELDPTNDQYQKVLERALEKQARSE